MLLLSEGVNKKLILRDYIHTKYMPKLLAAQKGTVAAMATAWRCCFWPAKVLKGKEEQRKSSTLVPEETMISGLANLIKTTIAKKQAQLFLQTDDPALILRVKICF